MATKNQAQTALCYHDATSIYVRDKDLCNDLIGKVNFTEMMFFDIMGRMPNDTEDAVINAVMVTLMEHGLTTSAIAARMVYSSAPEALQGGVAAGLLAAGSKILGTLENCAYLLEEIVADPAGIEAAALAKAKMYRETKQPLPGFGHQDHKPDDPRPFRHFELAEQYNLPGQHIEALKALSQSVDEVYGKHITINASASMAALLSEINLPKEVMRGIAVVTRAAGLVAHLYEEMKDPAMMPMMHACELAIPYSGEVTKA